MQTESAAPPGTLTGVMYSYPGGMDQPEATFSSGFHRKPSWKPSITRRSRRRAWTGMRYFEKENVPITAGQWAEVEQVVLELYPLMEPKPEPRIDLWSSLGRLLGGVKDGVSSSSITLIWDTEEGEQRIKYSSPNDKRISTLAALLKELADPIGREIPGMTRIAAGPSVTRQTHIIKI